MSREQSPVTPEEVSAARAILARASEHGIAPKGGRSSGYGAMTDGSKRLRESNQPEEEWERVVYAEPSSSMSEERLSANKKSDQLPLMPAAKNMTGGVPLPPGVADLTDWGRTVCKLPRVAKQGYSYSEMLDKPGLEGYLLWVFQHGQNRGGRLEDLANYLKAVGFAQHINAKEDQSFPGSSEQRQRK